MDEDRLKMIIKILDFDLLTDWECTFLESVEEQMETKGELSEKQEEFVDKIWEKYN